MFNLLDIKNFQSIKSASLELGRITVITGPSNLGKSAVARTVDTLVHNNFVNNRMRKGASTAEIALHEGERVVKFHRGTSSEYSLDGKYYTKIGRDVPEDVEKFLGMSPIKFDVDFSLDFNIHNQFDPPFLISNSGFETAKVFGKLMNLDLILSAAKEISKDQMAYNKRKDSLDLIEVSIEEYIQSNAYVEQQNLLLQEALGIEQRILKEEADISELEELIYQIEKLDIQTERNTQIIQILKDFDPDTSVQEVEILEDIFFDLESREASIEYSKTIIELLNLTPFDIGLDEAWFTSLEDLILDIEKNSARQKYISRVIELMDFRQFDFDYPAFQECAVLIENGTSINNSFTNHKTEFQKASINFNNALEEFNTFIDTNGLCPITKAVMSSECKTKLKEAYK